MTKEANLPSPRVYISPPRTRNQIICRRPDLSAATYVLLRTNLYVEISGSVRSSHSAELCLVDLKQVPVILLKETGPIYFISAPAVQLIRRKSWPTRKPLNRFAERMFCRKMLKENALLKENLLKK
jgi:hypothetical protein